MIKKVAVIGIGDFGSQLAIDLVQKGAEVLAIDMDMETLNDIKDRVTQTVCLDSREENALRSQGLPEFGAIVVGIGDDFEATLLTVAALQNIGVKRIIARATTEIHERILLHLGVKEIVLPSRETATRLANSILFEGVLDSFVLSGDYSVFEIQAPGKVVGKTIQELNLRGRYGVSLITIKRSEVKSALLGLREKTVESILGVPSDSTVIEKNDTLVIFANRQAIEKLMEAEG